MDDYTPSEVRLFGSVVFLVLLPVLAGIWLAPRLVPVPAIGLIRLEADIWAGSAAFVQAQIDEAREDDRVRAVVFIIDSPGGEVAATQAMYLEMRGLRAEMPVVASIESVAASGGYYVALAADPIYAKPSSTVGNVGVWSFVPAEIGVNDQVLASGPFKLTASNRDAFLREIEGIKQEFLATVLADRSERLGISPADLAQGLAYQGREARELGLVDHLGGRQQAIETAAMQAGLANYEVIDLGLRLIEEANMEAAGQAWFGAADPVSGRRTLPPGAYLLYDLRLGGAP